MARLGPVLVPLWPNVTFIEGCSELLRHLPLATAVAVRCGEQVHIGAAESSASGPECARYQGYARQASPRR